MDADVRQIIETLHAGPTAYVMALTGGGAGAAAQLLSVPGASKTVLEVVVPYHHLALAEFLGREPGQYCSEATAASMARRAFERASWMKPDAPVAGVACTATLATDRPKRGDHRCHAAIATRSQVNARSLVLAKGARDRAEEDAVVSAFLLNLMATTFGHSPTVPLSLLSDDKLGDLQTVPTFAEASATEARYCIGPDGGVDPSTDQPRVLLPGSFNPLHAGHLGMADAAARTLGCPVAFELSVVNVDKPPLAPEEIDRRSRQFRWKAPLWVTRAPTFVEKAELFPGTVFVVGADTAARIVSASYYGGEEARMFAALAAIQGRGCSFLVAGRVDASCSYVHCEHLAIPESFRGLFRAIPESDFRHDISSTALRGDQARSGRTN